MKVHYGVDVVNDSPVLRHASTGLLDEMTVERLPFTVSIARSDEQIDKAVAMRHAAYARHVPDFAEQLKKPELCDYEEGTAVLLAESKLDGAPLGTMRVQTNLHDPLEVEGSVELPDWLQGCNLAEATRLGVTLGRVGHVVKTMLFKAYFEYCRQVGIDWMLATGRAPLDRQYEALLFNDIFPERGFIPMRHVGNIPHRVLAFDVETAEERWAAAKHPLFNFVFRTRHPDMDLGRDEYRHGLIAGPGAAPYSLAVSQ